MGFYKFFAPAVALAVLLTLPGCKSPRPLKSGFDGLGDRLERAGVVRSPLLSSAASESAASEADYPVDSAPLLDAGDNPYGLARRLSLGSSIHRILFAPPESEYRFAARLPAHPTIAFGIGIVRDGNSERLLALEKGEDAGVDYQIILESGNSRKTVFRKRLALPPRRESRQTVIERAEVDLPGGGSDGRLILVTGGSKGAFSFWLGPHLRDRAAAKPNVILVSIDTLRADHVGVYGYERDTTPHLDALARDGVVFRNVYATAPWTLPSHVSLLTGLNNERHGVYRENDRIDPGLPLLAEILRARGYFCGAVTGGGLVSANYGFDRGFDYYGMNQIILSSPTLAGDAAKEVSGWLGQNASNPFFLFVHTYQPHYPYEPPPPYDAMYAGPSARTRRWELNGWTNVFRPLSEEDRRDLIGLYDGDIRYTDEALIGPLVGTLKTLGIYDRTLLIVTSDHGEEFYDHGGWTHTTSVYDEVLKVPLVVKLPGQDKAGDTVDSVARLTDLVPTILGVSGIDFGPERFDGESLLPLLGRRERADRSVLAGLAGNVMENRIPSRIAVVSYPYKLILNAPASADGQAHFAFPPPRVPAFEFYDLRAEPGERTNLADDPKAAAKVRAMLSAAEVAAKGVPERTDGRAPLSKDIQDQLRALGYIK